MLSRTHKTITKCRLCSNTQLLPVLSLGDQHFTGVFPKEKDEIVPKGRLDVVRCAGGAGSCGLVQLGHSFDNDQMYGATYGYRSGLNRSMVSHLEILAAESSKAASLRAGDIILDIGSNDGTLLSMFPKECVRVGVDPLYAKFKHFYDPTIIGLPAFFSAELVQRHFPGRTVKLITSIAMFYDLEDPLNFVIDVASVLSENGIWVFEQSYLPAMLDMLAYDTICHEHLEYYSLRQIRWLLDRAGLFISDVSFNGSNGGSFRVTAVKKRIALVPRELESAIRREELAALGEAETYLLFASRVERHRTELKRVISGLAQSGKVVCGYGASTKGNVILQYCGFDANSIPYIADVNPEKFGSYTPGTRIPIISEIEARQRFPDYYLVLPWHFRDGILEKERALGNSATKLIFPLPCIEVV